MWHYIMSPDFTAVITALEVRCRWSGALPRWYISLAAEWSGQTFEHNITWLWAELQVPPLGIRYQLQWDEWDARPQPGLWQGWRVCVCVRACGYMCVCVCVCWSQKVVGGWGSNSSYERRLAECPGHTDGNQSQGGWWCLMPEYSGGFGQWPRTRWPVPPGAGLPQAHANWVKWHRDGRAGKGGLADRAPCERCSFNCPGAPTPRGSPGVR